MFKVSYRQSYKVLSKIGVHLIGPYFLKHHLFVCLCLYHAKKLNFNKNFLYLIIHYIWFDKKTLYYIVYYLNFQSINSKYIEIKQE